MKGAQVELDDVQGLAASSYGHLPSARYLLLQIDGDDEGRATAAMRAWLGRIADEITTAGRRQEGTGVNLAFTFPGLMAAGLPAGTIGFANEFVSGMTTLQRRRLLGDVGESAPELWSWGGPHTRTIHFLLLLYAVDPSTLDALEDRLMGDAAGLSVLARLDTSNLREKDPNNFADGLSQPPVAGLTVPAGTAGALSAGEFVLGYTNGYGRVADAPALPGREPAFGRNGTYLVMRQMSKRVGAFWEFLEESTKGLDGTPDPAAATRLAARIVGRWPGGAPIVLSPDVDDPSLSTANDFSYADDLDGVRCPVGSHVRRANPRGSLAPNPRSRAAAASADRHRILRRGREYVIRPTDITEGDGGVGEEHGLYFICLVANLARQFEFVQGTWLNNPKFGGLYDETDPLVGTQPDRTFSIPGRPVRTRVRGIPSFVRVRGGAYFFLPGIRAIRSLGR